MLCQSLYHEFLIHNISNITQVGRTMFSQNSSGQVRSFCEWNWTLVSWNITRGSDTYCETTVNIVRMQRAVLAFWMWSFESDMTSDGWLGLVFRQHDKQHKFQTTRNSNNYLFESRVIKKQCLWITFGRLRDEIWLQSLDSTAGSRDPENGSPKGILHGLHVGNGLKPWFSAVFSQFQCPTSGKRACNRRLAFENGWELAFDP